MFEPLYTLSNKTVNNLIKITELRTFIEQSRIVPKQEMIMKRKAAIRMAASSTAIEGNVLNVHEVEKVFEGKMTNAPQKDELEVRNYKKGIEFINSITNDKVKLDHNLILHLHRILMNGLLPAEKMGEYRKGPVYVVNLGAKAQEDKLLYSAPPAEEVRQLVTELITWVDTSLAEELSIIIVSALFHYQFVTIHPFTDGNGRATRLLTTYLLYLGDFDLSKIYALDSYYNYDRMKYYEHLDLGKTFKAREKIELTDWLEYFTDGFVWELTRIRDQIHLIKHHTHEKSSETLFLDQDEIRMIDFVSTVGRITSNDVMDILKCSKRTAQMKIKRLLDHGLLDKKGEGPSSFYIMKENGN